YDAHGRQGKVSLGPVSGRLRAKVQHRVLYQGRSLQGEGSYRAAGPDGGIRCPCSIRGSASEMKAAKNERQSNGGSKTASGRGSRRDSVERKTSESRIKIALALDGTGRPRIQTPI